MSWVGSVALLVVVAILVLPPQAGHRTGALTRSGRLGARSTPTGTAPGTDPRTATGAFSTTMRGRSAPPADRPHLPPARLVLLAGAAACLALAVLAGPAPAFEVAVVLAVAAVLGRDARRARRQQRDLSEFRVTVGLLAGELQAGSPPAAALAAAAAGSPGLRSTLGPAVRAASNGASAVDALVASPDAHLRRLGVVWRVGETTGVPLSSVLGQLGVDLQSAADQRHAVAVVLAGPRSSAVLLCLLPVLGIGLGAAMGAHPLGLLFGTTAGQLLCCVGVLLDAAGVLWVRHILLRAAAR